MIFNCRTENPPVNMNRFRKRALVYFFISIAFFCNGQDITIKDKTKYYVKNIENFNNYSSNGWSLLEKKQLKVIAKALNINTGEAQKIIENTSSTNHPSNKKNTDVGYIMYKICELEGFRNGNFIYDKPDDILYLMYVPNELNIHLPPDKLAENGKGFYQVTRKESVSITPLSSDYYKPSGSLKDENYSFGFIFGPKGNDSLVVQKVIKSSPAEKAGLKINDVIIEFNGQNVKQASKKNAMKLFKESSFLNNTFKLLRNNSFQTISIDKTNAKTLEYVCISSNCDNGDCIIEHINGYKISGKCKDGVIIGNAKFTADDGFEFYDGAVRKLDSRFNNYIYIFNGFGKEKFKNGNSFEGNYVNGKKDGNGVLTFADGTQKKGVWKNDKYYDDISIGFANDRFLIENNRAYLHHLNSDFKSKMVDVTDVEKKKTMSQYKLTETEIDKLFALCDMKYKPAHLNTPQKIRTIIDQYQKDKPYEVYFVAQIYGTNKESYYIIYLPTAYNRWLPQGITFEVPDGLYFCVPATTVHFINYFAYERNLKILKGAEEDEKRKQEQAELSAKHYEWAAKNKFKGVVIIQYANQYTNKNNYDNESHKYNVVTIFGPPSSTIDESDYQTLLEKYKNYYVGYKHVTSKFEENMNEVQAIQKANDLTNTHKYSVNTNFSYTIPEKNTTYNEVIKESNKKLDELQKELVILNKEIIDDKTEEKAALTKKAMNAILISNIKTIPADTKVEIIDIASTDKYYQENKKFIGKKGITIGTLNENEDGTFYGIIQFSDEKYSTIFYNVKVKL